LVRLNENVSVYANYMTGLSQGQFAPVGTVNANQQFEPDETTQYEVGVKGQWGGLFTSLALFDISQPAGVIDPGTNVFSISGEQVHRGVEWTFAGEVRPRFRVLGGANYIDAELRGGDYDGAVAPGVPEWTANIGGEVDVGATGLTLTGRVIYTSDAYIFGDNLQSIPEWTRLDLGARYGVDISGRDVVFRINAVNVTGEDYWASAQGSGLSLGAPRSVLVSATVDF
jgi:iron complex outermembrane receptor protein